MAFVSNVVSFEWNRNNILLKRGTSFLMIEAEKVQELRLFKAQGEFSEFFTTKALVNREARRLFESWLRKDKDLLEKLFQEVTSN